MLCPEGINEMLMCCLGIQAVFTVSHQNLRETPPFRAGRKGGCLSEAAGLSANCCTSKNDIPQALLVASGASRHTDDAG